ncbi:hypothetical protein B0H16DRAFT_1449678 [Mycena metata]|uniref:Uncharacterized protein n=1 Tax=Mycena metata TaxID=1033252 RepID=A0AAD7K1H0_9AGAR|nr:hypothetical protein B0H16DRAFT_1449678 [Mycena metata]
MSADGGVTDDVLLFLLNVSVVIVRDQEFRYNIPRSRKKWQSKKKLDISFKHSQLTFYSAKPWWYLYETSDQLRAEFKITQDCRCPLSSSVDLSVLYSCQSFLGCDAPAQPWHLQLD